MVFPKRSKKKKNYKRPAKFSFPKTKAYKEYPCYILLYFDGSRPIDGRVFRTYDTLQKFLTSIAEKEKLIESLLGKEANILPLITPNPVKIPQEFWKEYRKADGFVIEALDLITKYGLLKDDAIYRIINITLDIDSDFDLVYPVWEELKEKLEMGQGYRIFKTKSGRFRAYIRISPTKDLKRAKELTAILYSFFEKKGLKADPTFAFRLNHPVFYEDYHAYTYELIEDAEGENRFFNLYRKAKKIQKEENLWEVGNTYIPEKIWGIKKKRKKVEIIKAPAFVKRLKLDIDYQLDVMELWKQRTQTLANKYDSYRYIHIVQPSIGWAKYLELPEDEVTEFLVGLLGESKRKDVEKGWKYVRELEFTVPESVKWAGKTREEWEGKVIAYLQFRREVSRQELLREVFANQKWLCDLIMNGLSNKGIVTFDFVVHGRGRPRKVYRLAEEARVPLRKAVGCENEISYLINNQVKVFQGVSLYSENRGDFSQYNNFSFEEYMGGGWIVETDVSENTGNSDINCKNSDILAGSVVEVEQEALRKKSRLSGSNSLANGRPLENGQSFNRSEIRWGREDEKNGSGKWIVEYHNTVYVKILRLGFKNQYQRLVSQAIKDSFSYGLRYLVFNDEKVAKELVELLRRVEANVLMRKLPD